MFIIKVTSYAFMAISILQVLFKYVLFFPKACSVLVSIFIWITFNWKCYQMNIFICPLPHREPSLFSAEREVPHCMHSPLAKSATRVLPPKSFGKAQRQQALLPCRPAMTSHCSGYPHCTCGKGKFPSRYCCEHRETFFIWGFPLSTHSWPCPTGR